MKRVNFPETETEKGNKDVRGIMKMENSSKIMSKQKAQERKKETDKN